MSHLKERAEKNCLNCNAEVQGRYCQNCGQENIETKETVWHLISHFFKDITHFDGKFFSTLKYLFARPGFLSKEYMIGRRASYVNPVRMYVFTSAFFFLIFFSFMKVDNSIVSDIKLNDKTFAEVEALDSLAFNIYTENVNKEDGHDSVPMSREEFKRYFDSTVIKGGIRFTNTEYKTKAAYDSALHSGIINHGWFKRQLVYKEIELNEKYHNEGGKAVKDYANILFHSLPQMLFVLLPLFAFILKLLYIRRKEYYYVNHSIFSIHFYIFSFITMLFIFALNKLNKELNWSVINYIVGLSVLGIFFYLYKAMRKFYQQRRAKTIFKFFLLCLLLVFTISFLFLIFIFYSLYKL
ncbi:MAG: DUF3667 domain-containing protein [Ferruginibacter sp.]